VSAVENLKAAGFPGNFIVYQDIMLFQKLWKTGGFRYHSERHVGAPVTALNFILLIPISKNFFVKEGIFYLI